MPSSIGFSDCSYLIIGGSVLARAGHDWRKQIRVIKT
jgi:hypothetical protein